MPAMLAVIKEVLYADNAAHVPCQPAWLRIDLPLSAVKGFLVFGLGHADADRQPETFDLLQYRLYACPAHPRRPTNSTRTSPIGIRFCSLLPYSAQKSADRQ